MKIIIISALGNDRVIGKNGKIPWHSKEDFLHFKNQTLNNVVLMGKNTYQSMGRALKNRKNIVVSREKIDIKDADVYNRYEEGLEMGKEYAKKNNCNLFIIGGASIYERGLEDAEYLYISYMKGSYKGDVFFPEFESTNNWIEKSRKEFNDFTFVIYQKKY